MELCTYDNTSCYKCQLSTELHGGRTYVIMQSLNQLINIGQSDSPECSCLAKHESSIHYLIDCFLYTGERQILFNLVEYYIPSFKTMNRNEKYKVLVMGIDPENPEITQTNVSISIAVQKFIFVTKRFSQ